MEAVYTISIADKIYIFLNKSVPWLVGIFLFFNPFPHTTSIREISFYLSLLFFLVLLFTGKRKFSFRTPLSVPFLLLFLWSCFGLIFALNKPNSVHDIYAHLFRYLFIYYMIINFFDSKKGFATLAWIVSISTSIYAIVVMADHYIVLKHHLTDLLGYDFPETSPNILAVVVIFGLLLSLFLLSGENPLYQNIILTLCSFLSVFTVLATQSRNGILSLGAATLVIFPMRKKILAYFFVGVVIVLIIGFLGAKSRGNQDVYLPKIRDINGAMSSVKDRIRIWFCYAEIIKEHPLVGAGFGMQTFEDEKLLMKYNQRVDDKYRGDVLYHGPHNIIMSMAVRVGLVGLAIFLYTLFIFLGMGWHLIRYSLDDFSKYWSRFLIGACTAFFIHGMSEDTLAGPTAVILYVIFAMMTILWRMRNEPETKPQNDL